MQVPDLVGRQFGKLSVLKYVGRETVYGRPSSMFHCACACGREAVVSAFDLKHGRRGSCGCGQSPVIEVDGVRRTAVEWHRALGLKPEFREITKRVYRTKCTYPEAIRWFMDRQRRRQAEAEAQAPKAA